MTTLVYKKPETSSATINQPINGANYPTQFDVRNPAAVRKLARGIGGAVLLVALATPTGQEAALNIGNGARNTVANISTVAKYWKAGIITYTPTQVRMPYETTPRAIAREIAGTNARDFPGIDDLLAFYIVRKNNLPNEDAAIKAGQIVTTLVSDPNGQNLGNLVGTVKKSIQ